MEAVKCLRPRGRLAPLSAGAIVVGLWTLLGGFAAYAVVWWPEHPMLKGTFAHTLQGTAILSTIFISPFVPLWLWIRHATWYVGPDGIAVYCRGRLKRSFAWPEITTLHILPFYAVVRSATRSFEEEIFWLGAEDVAWLREFAKDRLGQRLVA
jgi:hypothetical protein